ncbi:ubinuclein-1 isoform X3 [Plutella xylostella]|uniref:ubinuclein-1 isoform X3 n=1 Tax=Plutella xylostella TaxID=51655 RepID=UPI002032834B|nr:ubinuclein-1 isoform X3 [Plutella xylostella]
MSDPKRATLITVGGPKSAKNNVTKTVRLTINLDESNESKYPELNYKELVIAEERKKKVAKLENGKRNSGLDPFSDNDDDVERVARKFEQKYGGKSTYGRKGKTKHDEFADIGAGYDENDSFIDNTDGYDEMIPPECDTFYGGFYINCGSLEFKAVPESQLPGSDGEVTGNRKNKRRISSSSSEEESSDSSSESSHDEKDTKTVPNGDVHSHHTEHRKKKNKKIDKKKAKRIRRNDSSAATSGKQTSDDNCHANDESVDSRTSHSDSLTSKPAPSSENNATSDSSRDATDSKLELSLPAPVSELLEQLKCSLARLQLSAPGLSAPDMARAAAPHLLKLHHALESCTGHVQKCLWTRAARLLNTSRAKLCARVQTLVAQQNSQPPTPATQPTPAPPVGKRKHSAGELTEEEVAAMSEEQREARIVETLAELKALIDEKKPAMIASYNAECDRIQEERRKSQTTAPGAHVAQRLPKRRFPWCSYSRSLLARLARLGGPAPTSLLQDRVLPLFPKGFVRMPTLRRQADLKTGEEVKRPRANSSSQPSQPTASQPVAKPVSQPTVAPATITQTYTEPIHFPSSLTVTTTNKPEKTDYSDNKDKKSNSVTKTPLESPLGTILNSFTMPKDLIVEKEDRNKHEDDKYLPPSSIGSITITPVNNTAKSEKIHTNKVTTNNAASKVTNSTSKVINSVANSHDKQKEQGMIRVKTPATLIKEANEIACKDKDKHKSKPEKNHSQPKEKTLQSPLLIETNFVPKEKANPSPKLRKDEITHKAIDRITEDKLPRPVLIPVQHSPTFAKPDKRPPDAKKKKDLVIVSDVDPLGDYNEVISEPVAIDDSSSDVEVIEEKEKPETNSDAKPKSDVNKPSEVIRPKSDTVPSKDKSVIQKVNHKEKDRHSEKPKEIKGDKMDVDDTEADIDTVMRNLREMQDSQEPSFNSAFGVISSGRSSLNKMDGCSSSEVDVA